VQIQALGSNFVRIFGLSRCRERLDPASGVHVAGGAPRLLLRFRSTVDRHRLCGSCMTEKMIVHMTDDIKELCGMSAVSASASATLCLYGDAAEEAGLWVVALRTVVNLVVHSCNHNCLELRTISTPLAAIMSCAMRLRIQAVHMQRKLLELVTTLARCKTELDDNPKTDRRVRAPNGHDRY
jgi:hypothetical protein